MRYQTRVSLVATRQTPATPNFASPSLRDINSASKWQEKLKIRNKVKKWDLALPLDEREASMEYQLKKKGLEEPEINSPVQEENVPEFKKKGLLRKLKKKSSQFNKREVSMEYELKKKGLEESVINSPVQEDNVPEFKKRGLLRKLKKLSSKFSNKSLRSSMTMAETESFRVKKPDSFQESKISVEFVPGENDFAKSANLPEEEPVINSSVQDDKTVPEFKKKGLRRKFFKKASKFSNKSLRSSMATKESSQVNKPDSFRENKISVEFVPEDDDIAKLAYQSPAPAEDESDEGDSNIRSGWQRRKRFSKLNGYEFSAWLKEHSESLRSIGSRISVNRKSARESKISVQHIPGDDDIARSAYQNRTSFAMTSFAMEDELDNDSEFESPKPSPPPESPGVPGSSRRSRWQKTKRSSKLNGIKGFSSWLKEAGDSLRSIGTSFRKSARESKISMQHLPDDDGIARSANQSRNYNYDSEEDSPTPSPPPAEVMTSPVSEAGEDEANMNPFSTILGSSNRQQQIEKEINHYCIRAGEEQLDKEMRLEGVKALKIAANKFAYKKKKDNKLLPSIVNLLAGYEVFEEAEKYYYDPEDEYPLKYIAALREMSMNDGGEALDGEEVKGDDCDSDDELFDEPDNDQDRDHDGRGAVFVVLGSSPREMLIEAEVDKYCKLAAEEQLDKPMRDEGIKALKIGADKLAYKKMFYDSAKDQIIVFPTLAECLFGADVYEEAEKYYYLKEDEYPTKYMAALRDVVMEDVPDQDIDAMESIAIDCDENDEYFTTRLKEL